MENDFGLQNGILHSVAVMILHSDGNLHSMKAFGRS